MGPFRRKNIALLPDVIHRVLQSVFEKLVHARARATVKIAAAHHQNVMGSHQDRGDEPQVVAYGCHNCRKIWTSRNFEKSLAILVKSVSSPCIVMETQNRRGLTTRGAGTLSM